MLFDLRGRGRRRTVRIIYLGMAVLMGVGLIGFGIGGGFGSSGIFNATSGNNGSNSASFGDQVKQDQKLTQQQPADAAAWAKLAHDRFLLAGTGANYDNVNGKFTPMGQAVLAEVKAAWDRYLALNPSNPSADLAREMVQVFEGPGGLNLAAPAVAALQIVIASTPNPGAADYLRLAVYAYQAGNTRQGDLAAAKAVSLAPAAQRPQLKARLAALKRNPNGTGGAPTGTAATAGASTAGAATAGAATAGAAGSATGQTVTIPASSLKQGAPVKLPGASGTTH
jgi:hypothetical protein